MIRVSVFKLVYHHMPQAIRQRYHKASLESWIWNKWKSIFTSTSASLPLPSSWVWISIIYGMTTLNHILVIPSPPRTHLKPHMSFTKPKQKHINIEFKAIYICRYDSLYTYQDDFILLKHFFQSPKEKGFTYRLNSSGKKLM